MSEIFPVKVRGFASAVVVLTNWTMAFVVTKSFQDMMVSAEEAANQTVLLVCLFLFLFFVTQKVLQVLQLEGVCCCYRDIPIRQIS